MVRIGWLSPRYRRLPFLVSRSEHSAIEGALKHPPRLAFTAKLTLKRDFNTGAGPFHKEGRRCHLLLGYGACDTHVLPWCTDTNIGH
jgi:hypothetical protein